MGLVLREIDLRDAEPGEAEIHTPAAQVRQQRGGVKFLGLRSRDVHGRKATWLAAILAREAASLPPQGCLCLERQWISIWPTAAPRTLWARRWPAHWRVRRRPRAFRAAAC